jgi:hypothetical protein
MEGRHASDTLPTYCLLTLLRGLDLAPITRKADAQEAAQMPNSRCQDPDGRIQIPEPQEPKKQHDTPAFSPLPRSSRSSRSSRPPSVPSPGPGPQDPATHVSYPPPRPANRLNPTAPHLPPCRRADSRPKAPPRRMHSLYRTRGRSRAPRQVKGPWKAKAMSGPGLVCTYIDRGQARPARSARAWRLSWTGNLELRALVDGGSSQGRRDIVIYRAS